MSIRYLKYKDIDKKKWDACIHSAANSVVYARAFYLDNCTRNQWDALVYGDYEMLMPLPFRKKFGITYLYQPPFLQQAGIFFKEDPGESILTDFISEAAKRFKFAEINLNFLNRVSPQNEIQISPRINFILDLKKGYADIAAEYRENFSKNVKRGSKSALNYTETNGFDEAADLYRQLYSKRTPHCREEDYRSFNDNCRYLQKEGNLIVRTALLKGEIYAAAILFKDNRRLYNVASSVIPEGKKIRANYFLFDNIIREYSGQNLKLDFEGSDISSIADFYRSTGAVDEPYFFLKFNNLHPLLKILKP